ncbi:hypothetical protein OSB04_022248 [Centaurea solstitialis]|uniref:Uncharacterized protein n=1 Tax=Centaurea solstitialis TaxID=347529 RepID=A0AA38SVS5_9ASTR|nr:hypothetical protein OSB04_022248 [Centaurea solstitialis]
MNGGGGGGNGGRRRMGAPLSNRPKDRDEDLSLFREMKRDKDRAVSLLQPVSDDFESNGNYPIYGMASAKKGPGLAFLGESEKNDYDWLKTPPATPLFPSLEMETRNNHELVVQRELPIIQPLSRFAGKPEMEPKQRSIGAEVGRSKTTNPKPKIPARSVTPTGRPSSLFTDQKKNIKTAPIPLISTVHRTNVTEPANKSSTTPSMSKPPSERDARFNFLGTNQSKSIQGPISSSRTTQKPRGVSPLVTSRMPSRFPGFSDETPPNLKTDRSTSASRGRPVNPSTQTATVAPPQKPEISSMRARRQSCSPSVTRGRKVAPTSDENTTTVAAQKGSIGSSKMFNGGQILGSRMVDKMMSARKSSIDEKETKLKLNRSMNEESGYGRIMSKGSLDTETKRDSVHSRQVGISMVRKSTSTSYAPSSRLSGGSYRAL